ncbi:MAG: DUF309 domain-containing protein [Sulfuricurvum sp.]|nr:DUF309 domain-containing protein [Sulfuricurvum sp.]MDX9965862.1 DUF309 domain-containing protein [Sulfuricurvum sp.]
MAQTSEGITQAFGAFALALAQGRYYEAHEELEILWYPRRFEDDDEIRFWKGCINAAVSFELIKRGRPLPSRKAWGTYLKYRGCLERLVTPRKELYVRITQTIDQHRSFMMSEFLKAMEFRHACKRFDTQKKIPSEQFDSILEVARLSPSSFGMEPWRLIVVRNPSLRKALKPSCWNQSQIVEASELVIFTTDDDSVRSGTPYVRKMFNRRGLDEEAVNTYMNVYKNYLEPIECDEALLRNWTAKQCYIACANMMTYAATLGIDSCPIEGFDREEIEAILDLDEGRSVALICAFGYRVNPQGEHKRLDPGQIVEYR